jgi:hypothetical protein
VTWDAAKRRSPHALGVLVVLAAVAVLIAIPNGKHQRLSGQQRSRFSPVCASSGHLVSVTDIGPAARPGRRRIYRVHCSGGLTTNVAR